MKSISTTAPMHTPDDACQEHAIVKKTVSVIMATYNGERFLREQLDSILAQTYPISEIIIQDDCSMDGTPVICREYEARYAIVHFYENQNNIGVNANFKVAAMKATGDYVAISDQDDIWFPTKIEKQMAAIGSHDICFSDILRGPTVEQANPFAYKSSFEANLFFGIPGHTMLLRKEFIQDEDHWIEGFWYDWSLTVHAHMGQGLVHVSEPLNWHRKHVDSVTASQHTKYYDEKGRRKPSYEPYLTGLSNLRRLQTKPLFKAFFQRVEAITRDSSQPAAITVNTMSRLIQHSDVFSLLRLGWLCMTHRKETYPQDVHGVMGIIRSFFYPSIFAYHCTLFDN